MKSFLRLAVTNVHFKCNKMFCKQSDGSAIVDSLAVILANLWMKNFEKALQNPNGGWENNTPDKNGISFDCNQGVLLSEGKQPSANCVKIGYI